ncbi:hypothetical protein [Candidatus Solincola tengchongensis]|uniref:hypothetical protein n=1 Tax=Candidatus Solincola tengchongensis TaxID=2900693 RepID=UPI00257EB6E3|nr:hypothetical protein [Candidatus Solincola tengchongensis]
MKAIRTCSGCGVPLGVSRNMRWNGNGTITQVRDPAHRLIFFESDNLDRMWKALSEALGVTEEHVWELVIASKSRATRAFLHRTLPWYVNLAARLVGYRALMSAIEAQGLVMGYGKITLGGQYPRRGRPERVTVFIEDPYSLPLFCGDFKGAAEVLERRWASLTYQALDERRHQIDVTVSDEKLEEEYFHVQDGPPRREGDLAYTPCPECGAPRELVRFSWDLSRGIIRDTESGRRLAFFGTAALRAVFDELRHELGVRVTPTVIDAERRNTLGAMGVEEARSGFEGLRVRAAIRGLGLLTALSLSPERMEAVVANPALPEYLVGLALGIFELATGRKGESSWELVDGGDLRIEVIPAS